MGITRVNITGNAGTATRLQTARNIGGVSFNGAADINLPGVNQPGNQNTTGTASRALLGANTTAGVSDWNHSTNTQAGHSPTLLLGNAANGPSPVAEYFHCVNYEYGTSKDGTGEITQLAISYASPANGMFMRGRYQNVWTPWRAFTHSGQNTGDVGTYATLFLGAGLWAGPGDVISSVNLFYTAVSGSSIASPRPQGQWRCMGAAGGFSGIGQAGGAGNPANNVTTFLRIS